MAPKRSLKIKLSKLSNLCFTTSLHYLVDVCFIRQSAFIYGNTICSSSHRLFPIFVRGRLHTCIQSKQQQKYPLISLSAIKLGEFVDRIQLIEVTADTVCTASYHDIHVEMSSECQLRTNYYDHFNFPIDMFSIIWTAIPTVPVYEYTYINASQLILYSRAYHSYRDFLDRRLLLYCLVISQWLSSSYLFKRFTGVTITWLTATDYLCYQ